MNLVYIWIEEFGKLKNKGILMNKSYQVELVCPKDDEFKKNGFKIDEFKFKIIKKNTVESIYKNNKIIDSFAILGKNGSGKTTVINIINNFGNNSQRKKELSLIFMIFEDNDNYYIKFVSDKSVAVKINNKDALLFNINESTKFIETEKNILSCKVVNERYLKIEINSIISLTEKNSITLDYKQKFNYLISEYKDETIKNIIKKTIKIKSFIENNYSNEFVEKNEIIKECTEKIFKKVYDEIKNDTTYIKDLDELQEVIYLKLDSNLENFDEFIKRNTIKLAEIVASTDPLLKKAADYISSYKKIINYIKNNDFFEYNGENLMIQMESIINNEENINTVNCFLDCIYCFDEYVDVLLGESLSMGEKYYLELNALLDVFMNKIKENEYKSIYYMCFDEIESHLHPEWCRKLYSKIAKIINNANVEHEFFIYMCTHAPFIISDFIKDHIINLEENDDNDVQTFGANIYDILSEGMFLDNPMGEYAFSMIRRVQNALTTNSTIEGVLKDSCMKSKDKLDYFINCIGEPLIKIQLESMWNKICNNDNNNLYSLSDLESKDKNELIRIIRGVCNVKD